MSRVLFLSTIYPRSYDVTRGTYCRALCAALAHKHEVAVVSPRTWTEALVSPGPHSAQLDREVAEIHYPTYFYPPRFGHSSYGWWMWKSLSTRLRTLGRDFAPTAIIGYWAHPDGEVAVRLGGQLNIPVGIIVGGSDVLVLTREPRRKAVISNVLRSASMVFTVSQHLKEAVVSLGVDPSRVHVSYQGIDPSFSPGDMSQARQNLGLPLDEQILLWVGRFDPIKGIDVLLNAFAKVREKHSNVRLVLIGEGPLRQSMERKAAQLGVNEHIQFIGSVPQEDLPDWYRSANLTVLSSHSEGVPNVLRESLACGTPYVATAVGGIQELSDDPAIRLVPPAQPHALAEAMDDCIRSNRRIQPRPSGRGWDAYADSLMDLLKQPSSTLTALS